MKAAIIPSKGIGDALLMMVASHAFLQRGYEVATFHPKMEELIHWFPGHEFKAIPSVDELLGFDYVVIQNDNSELVNTLKSLAKKKKLKNLSIFYPTYLKEKHGPLSRKDVVFNAQKPMVDNIASALSKLFKEPAISKDNGLAPLSYLSHRKHSKRIAIHPTSSSYEKSWDLKRFAKVAHELQFRGYKPIFVMSPEEEKLLIWKELKVPVVAPQTLSDLASFIYESGYLIGNDSVMGHLASNLNIPQIIVAKSAEHMALWRPGWLRGNVVTPSKWIPNLKFLRLRERCWRGAIGYRTVLRSFDKLSRIF